MYLAIVVLTIILVSLPHIKDAKTGHTIKPNNTYQPVCFDSFSIPEYFDRIEKEHIKLLQEREQNPVSKVIELWWGLDGIRLLEDGTTEWVKRKSQSNYEKRTQIDADCNKTRTSQIDFIDTTTLGDTIHLGIMQQTQSIEKNICSLEHQLYMNMCQAAPYPSYTRWEPQCNSINPNLVFEMCGMNGIENANANIQRILDIRSKNQILNLQGQIQALEAETISNIQYCMLMEQLNCKR